MPSNPGSFACPSCDRSFRWKPELAGRRARCKCGGEIAVPTTAPEPADAYELAAPPIEPPPPAAAPAPRAAAATCGSCNAPMRPGAAICLACGANVRTGRKPALGAGVASVASAPPTERRHATAAETDAADARAALGLKLTGVGLLVHFAGYVLMLLGVGGAVAANYLGPDNAWAALPALLAIVAGGGLVLVGPLFYLAAPAEAGRAVVGVALGLYTANGVLQGVTAFYDLPEWLGIGGAMLNLAGTACLLVFYQQLADYLGDSSLRDTAARLMKLFVWCALGFVLLFIPIINCFAVFAVLGCVAVLGVWYVVYTGQLAHACLTHRR